VSRKCVSDDCLRDHVHGRLSCEEETILIEHLDSCDRCQATLESVAGDTAILAIARESAQATASHDPTLDHLLAKLQGCRDDNPHGCAKDHAIELERLDHIAHYTILGVVGRGGMGVALKARDEKLGRLVCLKLFAGPTTGADVARQRWMREARAAAAVQSEHVVKIYAVEQHEGRPFIAMEFVAGRSLQEEIDRRGALPTSEILHIARQAASGLAAAHAQGLVHRDIKPANILLEDETNKVRIADFGMARALDDSRLTTEGCVAGTPEYMTPEQALGQTVDHRADLFSLGSVLYAMCTGRSPFAADNSFAVLRRIIDDKPLSITRLCPAMPKRLAKLIDELHAKDPERRPQSANEVLVRLAGCDLPESPLRLSRRAALFAVGATLAGGASIAGMLSIPGSDSDRRAAANSLTPSPVVPRPTPILAIPARVLIILPQRGFYGLYFNALRRQFDVRGVKYHIASLTTHEAHSTDHEPAVTVKPNLLINYVRPAQYDLVYFAGGDGCNVFADGGSHSQQARRVIRDAIDSGCIVAAMGMASVVLAEAGVLRGRQATTTRWGKPPGEYIVRLEAGGAIWKDQPVVEDGQFLTGRDPEDVQQFVSVMLKRLEAVRQRRAPPQPGG
jgi:serine/threonine protein kinase/putative intracellular protease/amidase